MRRLSAFLLFFISAILFAHESLLLTLSETVEMAQQQSNDALAAKHSLEAAEWNYRRRYRSRHRLR